MKVLILGAAGQIGQMVTGDFLEFDKVRQAAEGVDAVYLSFVAKPAIITGVIDALDKAGVKRFIVANVPDLYQEVSGPFQTWYRQNTGLTWQTDLKKSADLVENSDLDYVILRITWLYNQVNNTKIHVSEKGEPLTEAQVTRQAVAHSF